MFYFQIIETLTISTKIKTIDDEGNKIILYTGSGQNGDQDINDKQNRVLNISNELSIKVYLFESYQIGKYIYQGEVYLSSSSYYEEQKVD